MLLRPVLVLPLHCRKPGSLQRLLLLTAASWARTLLLTLVAEGWGGPQCPGAESGSSCAMATVQLKGTATTKLEKCIGCTLGLPNHPKSWRLPCNLLGTQGRPYPDLLVTRLGCAGDSRTKQLPNRHSASPG